MDLNITQASDVLGKTPDEVLFMVQDGRLDAKFQQDAEIKYLDDGRIEFTGKGESTPEWIFDFDNVIKAKKELDESLDGELRDILELE